MTSAERLRALLERPGAVGLGADLGDRPFQVRTAHQVDRTADIERSGADATAQLVDAHAAADPRTPVETELATVETQIAHLTEAITMGGAMPTLVQRLHLEGHAGPSDGGVAAPSSGREGAGSPADSARAKAS